MLTNTSPISESLQRWFDVNKRELPWRNVSDPYTIWISEVILQQTRVAQGLPYFLRFLKRFPDIASLAAAGEQEVLSLWQGLGYYSRARNMHMTARQVVELYDGKFPANYEALKKLKGVGDYTASAVASLAMNEPHAVLDGNVYRVIARLKGIELPIDLPAAKKVFKGLADEIMDKKNPGRHNEAIMELGAMVCVPKNPECSSCPVNSHCVAYKEGKVSRLPVKQKKIRVRERYFHYLYLAEDDGVYLQRRVSGDIWEGLYEFPLLETTDKKFRTEKFEELLNTTVFDVESLWRKKHQLTHQLLHIYFYRGRLKNIPSNSSNMLIFVPFVNLHQFPLPKPFEIFFESILTERKK